MVVRGRWPEVLRQYAPRVVLGAAVLWMAASAADLFWLLSGKSRLPLPPAPEPVQVAASEPASSASLLPSLNLFGAPAATGPVSGEGPDTNLPITLKGVFLSADPAQSSALITENSQPLARLFHVNEPLPGNATLVGVQEGRVILRRADGRQEVLRFAKTPSLLGEPVNAASSNKPRETRPIEQDARFPKARELLKQAVVSMDEAPAGFVAEMGLAPSPQGYTVLKAAPERFIKALSLQPGDVVTRVNGRPVGDPEADRVQLRLLGKQGQARIEYLRDGKPMSSEYRF